MTIKELSDIRFHTRSEIMQSLYRINDVKELSDIRFHARSEIMQPLYRTNDDN